MKITPHLWFATQARQAAEFYASALPDSRVTQVRTLRNTPSGDVELVSFELGGLGFMAISAGPLFTFNPSISFLVGCATKDEVDALWATLSEAGRTHMPLGAYPFSERYGWTEDRYGLSWQIMYMDDRPLRQSVIPTLMFTKQMAGRCEEAIGHYTSIFPGSRVDHILRYGSREAPETAGTVKHAGFALGGQDFAAMDSAGPHDFSFNEAISLVVHCETQDEIDHVWARLSAVPQAEQCGWLKDKYGVSWQVVPTIMGEMMQRGTKEQSGRVTAAFLKMKKFDITALKRAYEAD
ncbi:MAG: VOC family protein [Acidobacteriota bacterium]|nr:VOC family protein [Acidobacteriota bacterium]